MACSSLVVPIILWGRHPPTHCISAVMITSDQRTIVTGCHDGQLILWDFNENMRISPRNMLFGHTSSITCLSRANDSWDKSNVISAAENGELCLWDTDDGRCIEHTKVAGTHTSMHPIQVTKGTGRESWVILHGYYADVHILDSNSLEVLFTLTSKVSPDWISALTLLRPVKRQEDVIIALTTSGMLKVWTLTGSESKDSEPLFEDESKPLRCLNAQTLTCCAFTLRTVLIVCQKYWQYLYTTACACTPWPVPVHHSLCLYTRASACTPRPRPVPVHQGQCLYTMATTTASACTPRPVPIHHGQCIHTTPRPEHLHHSLCLYTMVSACTPRPVPLHPCQCLYTTANTYTPQPVTIHHSQCLYTTASIGIHHSQCLYTTASAYTPQPVPIHHSQCLYTTANAYTPRPVPLHHSQCLYTTASAYTPQPVPLHHSQCLYTTASAYTPQPVPLHHSQCLYTSRCLYTTASAYTPQPVPLHHSQCLYTTASDYTPQSLPIHYDQCLYTIASAFTPQPVPLHHSQCLYTTASAFIPQPVHIHHSQCLYTTASAFTPQPVPLHHGQCLYTTASAFTPRPVPLHHSQCLYTTASAFTPRPVPLHHGQCLYTTASAYTPRPVPIHHGQCLYTTASAYTPRPVPIHHGQCLYTMVSGSPARKVSTSFESRRKQATAIVMLGVIGAEFGAEMNPSRAASNRRSVQEAGFGIKDYSLARHTAKALSFLLLHPPSSKLPAHTPIRRAAIDLIGRGFTVWEPYMDVSAALLGMLDLCCDSDKHSNAIKSGLPLTPSADSCRTAHHALSLIATARPSVFITTMAKEVARHQALAANAQYPTALLVASPLVKAKPEILRIIELLIDKMHNDVADLLVEVMDIIVHCLDPIQLKTKGLSEVFPAICRFNMVSYCPNSRRLAVGARNGALAMYDQRTAKCQMISGHQNAVTALSFSPDGKYLATYSYGDNRLFFWQTGNTLFGAIGIGSGTKCVKVYNTAQFEAGNQPHVLKLVRLVWISGKTVILLLANGSEYRYSA
ncbi:uncharacterized protein LOC100367391 [Saccoglossus kowalevskii]